MAYFNKLYTKIDLTNTSSKALISIYKINMSYTWFVKNKWIINESVGLWYVYI